MTSEVDPAAQRRDLFNSLRPRHWSKNVLVFAPLVFAGRATELLSLLQALAAFALFCGLSGAGYLLNDLVDRERDRLHASKRYRPITAGRLPISKALHTSLLLYGCSLILSFLLGGRFGWVALAYAAVTLSYNLLLRNVVIVDLFAVAAGYVLRVVAGAVVIAVQVSSWLLICTMLLSLFIALSKRSLEIRILGEEAGNHRKTLADYSTYLLDQMTAVITSALLAAYTLYTRSPVTVNKFHSSDLVYTVPFMLYGIFRYLYLVHIKEGSYTLEKVLITDRSMIINLVLYGLVVGWVVYLR